MDKKRILIIIVIIAIIAIAGVAVYSWYNAQFDDNLVKASGYQEIGLKSVNEDFINTFEKLDASNSDKESVKTIYPALQKYLNESKDAHTNIAYYLNNAKKYAKDDVERNYIDLLLKKNEGNIKVDKNYQNIIVALEKYSKGELSFSETYSEIQKVSREDTNTTANAEEINNDIIKLLNENPEFKKHLSSLNIDETYLGENPSESN